MIVAVFFYLMLPRPSIFSRTDTLCPYTTLYRSPTPPGQDVTVDSNVYNEQPASDNVVAENRAATSAAPVPATAPVTEANPAVYQKDDLIGARSAEHTSELQYLMRNSYAVYCLNKITLATKLN